MSGSLLFFFAVNIALNEFVTMVYLPTLLLMDIEVPILDYYK
jgi:hypothetical protein